MIAAAVWFHLERGVDITDIVRYFYPEYEFPDTLYRFYDKEHVDGKMIVRSHKQDAPFKYNDIITVSDYQVNYKYK